MRDLSWRLVQVRLSFQEVSRVRESVYLSSVISMVMSRELIDMPRKVIISAGPSIFSVARGMARSWNALMIVLSWDFAVEMSLLSAAKKSSE